jgi:hypothetical protein
MGLVQDIREEVLLECDPGKDAGCLPLIAMPRKSFDMRATNAKTRTTLSLCAASNTLPRTRLSLPKLLISATRIAVFGAQNPTVSCASAPDRLPHLNQRGILTARGEEC